MASHPSPPVVRDLRVAALLEAPRYEVIPVRGIEDKVAALPAGSRVTVTASPAQGLARTIEVAESLAARGYDVIPHLAARMVSGRSELAGWAERLAAAGVHEAFVVGGDATPPAGPFNDAGDLLDELAGMPNPFTRIGIGGYPEGHPLIADEELLDALRRKRQYADEIVTQLCLDAGVLIDWVRMIRAEGIDLPVVVGLPGVVERRKLAEISLKSGVGASLRYLRRHRRQLAALSRSRRYDPTPLVRSIAEGLDQAANGAALRRPGERAEELGVRGAHLFTFNQVEPTLLWVDGVTGA
jgi:methylenetetrahydrofolate reductase (NADPH)